MSAAIETEGRGCAHGSPVDRPGGLAGLRSDIVSGFGIGTILRPVFALCFPVPLAVAATAVVHVANNLFKFGLMAKQADWQVVARFGIPAASPARRRSQTCRALFRAT